MSSAALRPHVEFTGAGKNPAARTAGAARKAAWSPSAILATSSFTRGSASSCRPSMRHDLPRAQAARAQPAHGSLARTHPAAFFLSAAPTAPRSARRWPAPASCSACSPTKAPRACALPFLGHDCDTSTRARGFCAALQLPRFTPPSVTASAWQNGGWNSATKFPRTKTAMPRPIRGHHARREPRVWKPPCAATRPTGSGSTAAGRRVEMSRRPSHHTCHLPSAPRILVRGTNWLGDAVMTTPALLRLREKFPAAHIALLTPEKLRELVAASSGGG